ncbi:MAG: DUF4255 domain-containing protein [Salana multivorans]|uniref:DUF4255 domain-containing protein n=1 Tax=Salana multivorans TaxID=120377 RepID=UPI0009685E3D|nr:DUF4255 domain-containing protein [Salana multivorans]MBN8881418.1 DUF4255 domain-containing protein [Salana multivorans]OJX97977.1 MAG: hypothetical protein BGO96_13890 [Micrococcales bacterium 73-15]
MIPQVDDLLKETVRSALAGSDVDVVLDAPTKEWAARRNAPTISLYLYDLREDPRRRSRGVIELRGDDGLVTRRMSPPPVFRLSYLVTAWTQRPEDEHRLLDTVLVRLLGLPTLPGYRPVGALADSGISAPLLVALPPPEDRGLADIWSALGGELKPSVDVAVIVPADVPVDDHIAPPVREGLLLDMAGTDGTGGTDAGVQRHVPPPATGDGTAAGGGDDRGGGGDGSSGGARGGRGGSGAGGRAGGTGRGGTGSGAGSARDVDAPDGAAGTRDPGEDGAGTDGTAARGLGLDLGAQARRGRRRTSS